MNIRGVELLREKGFPVLENFVSFRELSELSSEYLDIFGDQNMWGIYGSDDRYLLTSNPHIMKKFRKYHLSQREISEYFNKLGNEMLDAGIPKENHLFCLWKCFEEEKFEITGTVWKKENEIYIDFFKGIRPSGIDWNPHFYLIVLIVNGKFYFKNEIPHEYDLLARKICRDLCSFNQDGAYLDFALEFSGKFLYHDLGFY